MSYEGKRELTETDRFRWVICQLIELRKCVNIKSLRHSLNSLPRDLDETYERILCSIDECNKDYALRILRWVTFSLTTLTTSEAAQLVAVDIADEGRLDEAEVLPDPLDLLTICPGLLSIYTEKLDDETWRTLPYLSRDVLRDPYERKPLQYVALAHYSVQEYLVSTRILEGKAKFWGLQDQLSHSVIAQSCLVYLLNADLNLVKVWHIFDTNVSIDEHCPLADYCSRYWWEHARQAFNEAEDDLYRFAKRLFGSRDKFLKSLQIPHGIKVKLGQDLMAEALVYSARAGVEYLVKRLVEEDNVNIDIGNQFYGTALQAASYSGHEKIVELLLESGAEFETGGAFVLTRIGSRSPLSAASRNGHEEIVRLLIQSGASPNSSIYDMFHDPLVLASRRGHEKIVEMLLDAGAQRSTFALVEASFQGSENIVQMLLQAGANVNTLSPYKIVYSETALAAASFAGHEPIVRMLLQAGANVNFGMNIVLRTALEAAIASGHLAIVELLQQAGAKSRVREAEGSGIVHQKEWDPDDYSQADEYNS
jgi:ankyrin repeat protein